MGGTFWNGSAVEMGILDPASTVEAVLRRACSIASLMLSVDTVIVDPPASGLERERPDMSAKFD
jgi:chaperonin GroEL (HSP60 family)